MSDLSPESMERRILEASEWRQLKELRDAFQAGFEEHHSASSITDHLEKLNRMHDAFIRRTVQLAEAELQEEGQGEPPVPYSFLLFGSGGRSEQTLWSDQDNGLIFDAQDASEIDAADGYFTQLADRIRAGLERLGYPPCEGNVICTNARWRKSLPQWLDMLRGWLEEPDFEQVRYLLITADARCVYGDERLCTRLKECLFAYKEEQPKILQAMVNNTLRHKVLLGPFGNLLRERYGEDTGAIDVKYGSYIPMVNGIRMLAIRESIYASGTLDRLAELRARRAIPEQYAELWHEAFEFNLRLRLTASGETENGLHTSNGKLKVNAMNKDQIQQIKHCLRIGQQLQRYVKKHGARKI